MTRLPSFFESPHALAGLDSHESILVGLSGGADSVSLLHILCDYARVAGCKIYAAHINHNIRTDEYGYEAQRDEDFCYALCRKLNIPLFVKKVDIPSLSKESGVSLEGCARDERYKFFSEIMLEHSIKILALAHNANDNLETQIFNLCRGSSVLGMEGIKKKRELEGNFGVVVRPLILATKAQILDFCAENSISYMTDSTNFELDATRNKIRHKIIPELEAIFPSASASSARLSESARECYDFVASEAQKIMDEHLVCENKRLSIKIDVLCKLHIALQKHIIAYMQKQLDIMPEHIHICNALALASRAQPHSRISLPQNRVMAIEDLSLVAYEEFLEDTKKEFFDYPLHRGFNILDGDEFAVGIYDKDEENVDSVYTLYTYCYVKCDTMNNMHARQRLSGDKIIDGGNTKSLKKLMCDKKVPTQHRDKLPIICSGEQIIYIPLCAVSDGAKAKNDNSYVKICIYKKGK